MSSIDLMVYFIRWFNHDKDYRNVWSRNKLRLLNNLQEQLWDLWKNEYGEFMFMPRSDEWTIKNNVNSFEHGV